MKVAREGQTILTLLRNPLRLIESKALDASISITVSDYSQNVIFFVSASKASFIVKRENTIFHIFCLDLNGSVDIFLVMFSIKRLEISLVDKYFFFEDLGKF